MKLSFETFKSKLDLFSYRPQFRPSSKLKTFPTPAGLLASIALLIVCIIFFTVRCNTLSQRLGVAYNTYIQTDYYFKNNNYNWAFNVGQPD